MCRMLSSLSHGIKASSRESSGNLVKLHCLFEQCPFPVQYFSLFCINIILSNSKIKQQLTWTLPCPVSSSLNGWTTKINCKKHTGKTPLLRFSNEHEQQLCLPVWEHLRELNTSSLPLLLPLFWLLDSLSFWLSSPLSPGASDTRSRRLVLGGARLRGVHTAHWAVHALSSTRPSRALSSALLP